MCPTYTTYDSITGAAGGCSIAMGSHHRLEQYHRRAPEGSCAPDQRCAAPVVTGRRQTAARQLPTQDLTLNLGTPVNIPWRLHSYART